MLETTQATDPRTGIAISYPAVGPMPRAVAASTSVRLPANASFLAPLEARALTVRADRDEEIVAQEDPATYCYLVVSGCMRTTRLMEDGRRQVGEFLFAGDLFGWEALDRHDFGAEAVTQVTLRRYPRRDLENLADHDRDVARRLREFSSRRLRAGREHMLLLGRKTAVERVAAFLLEMDCRTGADKMSLPMTRRDIADYLGLTFETVSRALSRLRKAGVLTFLDHDQREIMLNDRRRLADFDPQGPAQPCYQNATGRTGDDEGYTVPPHR